MEMKGKLVAGLGVACALLTFAGPVIAQGAKPKRVQVAIKDFDYGTISYHWWGDYNIGKGMADQVANELVNDGSLSVIERKNLDTVLAEQDFANSDRADASAAKQSKIGKVKGVRYIIAGSITKFGGEEKNYGGGAFGGGKIGGLGLKKAKTYVTLTARLIDTSTGEVVFSAKGEGLSTKGGGIKVGGAGGGGGAGFSMGSSNYKESAIGEAQEMACKQLVAQIVANRDKLEP
jgi:curli biogenesis system outer membrane secretion channel CsgG